MAAFAYCILLNDVANGRTIKQLGRTIKKLDRTIKQLGRTIKQLGRTIKKLQEENDKLVETHEKIVGMSSAKRFVMNSEGPIAFTAAVVPICHLKTNDVIKFETMIIDIGGGYNNQTGVFVFVAPASGIYMFSCSLLDDLEAHGVTVHAELVHGQRVIARIFAHAEASIYRDQGAQTVFAYVNQGDQVFVRVIDNDNLGLGGELYSTFSGYLLYHMML